MLATTGTLEWVDFTGQTPFIRAALAGDVTVMKLLLARGADPKIPTFGGTTALMAAAGVNWVVDQTADEGPKALLEAVQLCVELGPRRQRDQLDGVHRGTRCRQPRLGRHPPLPAGKGARLT
jgi:hypothetical protein